MQATSWLGMVTATSLVAVIGGASDAQAAMFTYTGIFAPEEIGATGTGTTTIQIDDVANTMTVAATFSGLSGNVTVAHIHGPTASPGTGTAGVMVGMTGFPLGASAGSYSSLFDLTSESIYSGTFLTNSGGTAAGAQAALMASLDSGTAYLNIHSTAFPGGEIRAFPTVVPEPLTLLGAGTAVALGAIFKKKKTV